MEKESQIGCVIMASGLSQRFGSNKLMAPFHGQALICRAFAATDTPLLAARIVVTRSPEVCALCDARDIQVLYHTMPARSDTIRLGLSALLEQNPQLEGCMFLPGDQPLLQTESVEALIQAFYRTKKRDICRLFYEDAQSRTVGSPVLFGSRHFEQLLHLPEGKGGSVILKQCPEDITNVAARSPWELVDADTPEALAQLEGSLPLD